MKLVITQHRPIRKALLWLGFAGAAALAVAVALDYGHWQAIADAMGTTGSKRQLLEEVAELRRENAKLEYELTRLARVEQINQATREDNHQRLVELQSKIAALNRDLEFYRDVLAETEVESTPKVKGVQIRRLDGAQRFSYRLMLTHVDKNDKTAEGRLRIGVEGDLGGQRRALEFAEVVESGPRELSFKFKHFRLIEGTIRIPDGFVPRQIQVAVHSTAPTRSSVTETYDWAAVLN